MGARIGMDGMNQEKEGCETVLELCALDNAVTTPAEITVRPEWESIYVALKNAFQNGGFVDLKVLSPKTTFIKQLSMKSLPGKYRLVVLTRSADPKSELQEWWEPSDSTFRGVVRFGDDDWDARTVCTELSVALDTFKELFDYGNLPTGLLQMRSQWNPKP